jgi:hypothetical protein
VGPGGRSPERPPATYLSPMADLQAGKRLAVNALFAVGAVLTAVGLVLPFASNEADCLDHCADAHGYYAWNPIHNVGAPFLVVGIVACVGLWRSPSRRRVLGLFLQFDYAPAVIEELHLYGGPSVEVADTAWVLVVGYITLATAALLTFSLHTAPTPTPAPTP